jgi:amino-acid N-acetyltransferase
MIRKATKDDVAAIMAIVNVFAARELMLPRTTDEMQEHIGDFFVCEQDGRIVGCAGLHPSAEGLGEIRSLAVVDEVQHSGFGTALVQQCLEEARRMGMERVFTLTYAPYFFRRLGFSDYDKGNLPSKIWSDCRKCPKFENCDEEAVIIYLMA